MNNSFAKWPEDANAPREYPCKHDFEYNADQVFEYKRDFYVRAENWAGYYKTDTFRRLGSFRVNAGDWERTTRYRYEQAKYYGRRVT